MTRTISTILTIAFLASPAASEELTREEITELCGTIRELAVVIMELRQESVPMGMVMGAILEGAEDNTAYEMTVAMITDAYNQPDYRTDDNQAQSIISFSNEAEITCYNSFR